MKITIPELALVVLVGPSGSGKSTFAKKHFLPTEILSSDLCRGLVSDDENSQAATNDAFDVLHFIARKRLAAGKLTVIDATNVQEEARKPLVALAREYHLIPVAIVFDVPEKLCAERNKNRSDRNFGEHVIRQQHRQMRRSIRALKRERFRHIFVLSSPEDMDVTTIEREKLYNNLKHEHGPFDIIGDVHGCCDELEILLQKLGYDKKMLDAIEQGIFYAHPEGRKAVFLGDLVDRGPRILDTLRLVKNMVKEGTALCVPGNHDIKLLRKLRGKDVKITHGLEMTTNEIEAVTETRRETFLKEITEFIDSLVSHYVLDDGKLVVAHAGMKAEMQGRGSGKVRDFALFGETTGETDEFGLPVRCNWAAEYRGKATVVYGHTPVPEPEWLNHTINIDTGCVFGGKLTALRYPEKELVSVPAEREYYKPAKPFLDAEQSTTLSAQQQHDDILDIDDVLGKRIIPTRLHHTVTIREENSAAALEVMSRFAANPKWLIYLPPTMSPCETSKRKEYLEYPEEAFAYYRHQGISEVICEEKHMGSRAIVIVCKDEDAARQRFGVLNEGIGICTTRTGRKFFDDEKFERELLNRVRDAMTQSGLWEELNTEWVLLDCELMPWSVKAQELLRQQYAAVGASSQAALTQAIQTLEKAKSKGPDTTALLEEYEQRKQASENYVKAYRKYCWTVKSVNDIKLAPFHLLATEKGVHANKNHAWHMEMIGKLCTKDSGILMQTPFKIVSLNDEASMQDAVLWWETLTAEGDEGMVVKPVDFVARGKRGLVQPAVKCRGREYLRIIYGPEYTLPENLERLRSRALFAKRSLALREFALGIEGLERFVRREPLRRVHECVFGVLALESEPVDPRL